MTELQPTKKMLEFAFETPEGNTFWPLRAEWLEKEIELVEVKRRHKALNTYATAGRVVTVSTDASLRQQKARTALAAAYRAKDIRKEYKIELLRLAKELDWSHEKLDNHAVGPHRPGEESRSNA